MYKNKCIVVHDILPIRFPEVYPRLKYYYYFIIPKILKTSKYIVFDSKSTQEETIKYYNLNNLVSSVIYPGYDSKIFHQTEKGYILKEMGYDKYFFYVGEMRPYKNLKNAIIAFSKIERQDIFFLIAGRKDNKFFPEIKKLTEELDIEKRVKFLDYVSLELLPHLYNNAIALVFPSRYEGFGLPLVESMAMGTPAITTNLTSIPEVCGDAALYVSPDNINEMINCFEILLNNSDLRDTLSARSFDRARKFGWEKTAREYYNILTAIND
jgi:glycosyltransferase involved in cell wall biosynthesis